MNVGSDSCPNLTISIDRNAGSVIKLKIGARYSEIQTAQGGTLGGFRRRNLALFVVGGISIILFCICAKQELTSGHNWGDDFGLYLQLAENIITGQPYNELNTGVRVPPGFPLIIAAAMEISGTGLREIKLVNVLSWALVALISTILAARLLGAVAALLMLAMVLMLPAYVFLQQSINADIPFLLFSTATLALSIGYMRLSDWRRYLLLALLAASSFYGLLIRPAGLPLFIGIAGGCLLTAIHRRSLRQDQLHLGAVVVTLTGVLVIYSTVFGGSAGDFTKIAMQTLRASGSTLPEAIMNTIIHRSADEWRNFNVLFFGFPVVPVKGAVLLALVGAGAVTYILHTRDWVVPTFAGAYIAMIIMTPWNGGARYLLPIVPVVILFIAAPYSFTSALVTTVQQPTIRFACVGVMFAALALSVWLAGQTIAGAWRLRGFDDNKIATPATQEMIDAIKLHSAPGEKVCSPKPRAVMYLAKRRGCWIPPQLSMPLSELLTSQGAVLAVLFTSEDQAVYRQFDHASQKDRTLLEIFRNRDYSIYRLALPVSRPSTARPEQ